MKDTGAATNGADQRARTDRPGSGRILRPIYEQSQLIFWILWRLRPAMAVEKNLVDHPLGLCPLCRQGNPRGNGGRFRSLHHHRRNSRRPRQARPYDLSPRLRVRRRPALQPRLRAYLHQHRLTPHARELPAQLPPVSEHASTTASASPISRRHAYHPSSGIAHLALTPSAANIFSADARNASPAPIA